MSFTDKFGADGYGTSVAIYQQNKYPQYTKTYYGTSASVAYSASVFYAYGWQVKVTSGNPWVMEANLNLELGSDGITPVTDTGSFVTINWSYHYKTTEKEILHVGNNVISWLNQVTPAERQILENHAANPSATGDVAWTASLSSSASMVIWNMMQSGFKTVPVVTPILRKSMTVPSTFNLTSFNSNLNHYYSKANLSTAIGIPTNWYNIMPQDTDPSASFTSGITYYYGWLKNPPTQDQNGSTITIQQDFEYGLYPSNIYGSRL